MPNTSGPTALSGFSAGDHALVVALNTSGAETMRLESLGIMPGVEVAVLTVGAGPLLLCVGEARVVVEQEIAAKVLAV